MSLFGPPQSECSKGYCILIHNESLWRQPDFLKLWGSQAISKIGSQISFIALPATAILTLNATPGQMGVLTAMSSLPPILLGLQSGAIIDRRARRPIMIATDVGSAVLLVCVPLAWFLNALTIELLYLIAFLTGALALISSVAHQAVLPLVVERKDLVDANSKMALMSTVAEVTGPTIAGVLVRLLTAPIALLADAMSFLGSALLLSRLRVKELTPSSPDPRRRIWRDISEGMQMAIGESRLRALIGSRALLNFFNAMLETVFILYIIRELNIGVAMLGIIFSIGSIGFLVGALLPDRMARRLGVGPTMVVGIAVVAVSDLIVPFAGGTSVVVIVLLMIAQFFFGLGLTVFNVHQASLRQALVPLEYLGRVGATIRVLADGLTPLGALLGGVMGAAFGLRETLILAALGELLAAVWLWYSPVRAIGQLPSPAEARA